MNVADRRSGLATLLVCVGCLAYFETRVFGFSGTPVTPIFQLLLTVYDYQTAYVMVAVCLLALLWRRPAPISRIVDALGRHPVRAALAGATLLAVAAAYVYQRYPLSMDEYSAVFQAQVFASGHVVARLPPSVVDWLIPPGFNGSFLYASRETGRTIEQYLPGFALLLAPFEFLGVPWLCNPLLAALAIYLIHAITLEVTGERRAAGWAVLFACCSSVFWANAISYYAMQAHLTFNLLYAWLLLKPSISRALAAGVVGSTALILHNPVSHALFAAPWILHMALAKEQRRFLPPLVLGYLPIAAGIGVAWIFLRTTIAGTATAADVMAVTANAILRWPNLAILDLRLGALVKMWIWAVPGLYLAAFLGRIRRADDPRVRLLARSAVLTFCGYLFVTLDQGHGWGYRYFHGAFGVIPILAGCAMTSRSGPQEKLASFAGAAAVLSLLILVPFQMSQIHGFIARHLTLVPPPRRPGNNVYFIQPDRGFYIADMIQCDPRLRSPDLLLNSRGRALDAELIRQNWPHAVKLRVGVGVEQWYLGPVDQRRATPGQPGGPHFVLAFTPPAVPAR
jgi:hypothetical protein